MKYITWPYFRRFVLLTLWGDSAVLLIADGHHVIGVGMLIVFAAALFITFDGTSERSAARRKLLTRLQAETPSRLTTDEQS